MSRRMRAGLLTSMALLVLGAACGGGGKSSATTTTTTSTAEPLPDTPKAILEQLRSESCACKTAACGDTLVRRLASFVDEHREADVGRVNARELAKIGVAAGECMVAAGVPKHRVADAMGRGRPVELLTHIVGGMCACKRADRSCGAGHLDRYDRFVTGNAEATAAKRGKAKHAALTARFDECLLRTGLSENESLATLGKRATPPKHPPSTRIAEKLEGIATAACACADRACGDKQLLALVAHVQQHASARPVKTTVARVKSAAKRTTTCLIKAGVPTDAILAALKRALN